MADLSTVQVKRISAEVHDKKESKLYFKFVVPSCVLRKLRLIGPKLLTGVIDFGFEEFTWHSNHHFATMFFRIGVNGETDDLKLVVGEYDKDGIGSMHIYTTFDRTLYVRLSVNCRPDEIEVLASEIELEVTTMSADGPPPLYQEVTVAGQTWRHSNMRDDWIGNNLILNSDGCLVFKFWCNCSC